MGIPGKYFTMLNVLKSSQLTLPDSAIDWLQILHKPTVIEIEGEDTQQWRVASTLIHGNEPSGFFAAYEFIKESIRPETNLAILISSVRAARHESFFTHRHIPGEFDLNRRFGILDCHDRVTELARYLTEYIRSICPQLVVDLHNTSGKGPAFAVSINDHSSVRKVASLFTQQMVVTQLVVGSLMEQNFNCPIVTIECGGAEEEKSHSIAYKGLINFAQIKDVFTVDETSMNVYFHPVRIKAHKGISLGYSTDQDDDVDITLIDNIEEYNEVKAPAGTVFGWLDRSIHDSLTAINDRGEEVISALFEVKDKSLLAKRDLKIFMATRRADIALDDCLFYAVAI